VAGKVWQEKCGRKKCGRKNATKKCGRKIAATVWLGSIYERYGTSCLSLLVQVVRLLVQVDSDKLIVAVVDSVKVTGCLHLEFIF
jgi:hypothetical protein